MSEKIRKQVTIRDYIVNTAGLIYIIGLIAGRVLIEDWVSFLISVFGISMCSASACMLVVGIKDKDQSLIGMAVWAGVLSGIFSAPAVYSMVKLLY